MWESAGGPAAPLTVGAFYVGKTEATDPVRGARLMMADEELHLKDWRDEDIVANATGLNVLDRISNQLEGLQREIDELKFSCDVYFKVRQHTILTWF